MRRNQSILLSLILASNILMVYSFSYSSFYYKINSKGTISALFLHPYGILRVGNETIGQNPSFFYDELGRLVTLRMYQSGHRGIGYYTQPIPAGKYAGQTWAQAEILFAKDAEFNVFRIHMFFGSQYESPNERLFPARRQVNEAVMQYFVNHLENLANNNIYFVLDGYPHEAIGSYWLMAEFNGKGGLLWNTTVQEDYIWVWNTTLTYIYNKGENVWEHLVFIEPWSEWLLGGTFASRDPYRYNGSVPEMGNAALVSWQNWLRKKYNNNIEVLKSFWGTSVVGNQPERWNYSGVETNDFSSLIMPLKMMRNSYNRAYDFSCWYAECIVNFTKKFNMALKSSFPNLYIAWDGWQSVLDGGANLRPNNFYPRISTAFWYSDVLDGHDFGSPTQDFSYFLGDRFAYQQLQMAAVARTIKKPYVTGEFGHTTSLSVGYDPAQDWNNYAVWSLTLQKALRYGYAGWCPYWVSYFHSYATGNTNVILRCDARQPYIRQLNTIYKAAENWIDKNKYDPIMIVSTAGNHFYTYESVTGGVFTIKLFDQAGYVPKYWGFTYDNETFIPEPIPEDVEIIVLGELVLSGEMSKKELKIISDWLNSDPKHKLIICHEVSRDFLLKSSFNWENVLNTTLFPLSTVARSTTYIPRFSNTDFYVTVDGTPVLLERSNNYHSGYYIEFVENYITGTRLINYSATGKPMTIINNRIAWIGSVIAYQCGNPDTNTYAASTNGYLIIRKILTYWGYKPKIDITQSYWRVGYGFAKIDSAHGILGVFSINGTSSGTVNPKLNFTRMGLSKDYNYVLFSTKTENTLLKTPSELENIGISISLEPMSMDIVILRKSDNLCYLYSNSYILSETLTDQGLICEFVGEARQKDVIYFYFPFTMTSQWKISFNNGTIVDAEHYYNAENKIVKIPLVFQYPKLIINIYRK